MKAIRKKSNTVKTEQLGPHIKGVRNWQKSTEAQVEESVLNRRREVRKYR